MKLLGPALAPLMALASSAIAAPPPPPPSEVAQFQAAVDAWRERHPVTEEEWEQMDRNARTKAFKVAGVTNLQILADVWEELDRAVAAGTTFQAFQEAAAAKLESEWGTADPAHLQTTFDTNVKVAYSAGRIGMMSSPDVKSHRPYWMLLGVNDKDQTPECHALTVPPTVLHADDPFWDDHQPPLHFRCRDRLDSMTPDQAQEQGITEEAPEIPAAKGFGRVVNDADWEPDLSKLPPRLVEAWKRRTGP